MKRLLFVAVIFLFSFIISTKAQIQPSRTTVAKSIKGVEISTIKGWYANIYPWTYIPMWSTVHPVPQLWTPGKYQTSGQIINQIRQLEEYGSGADVLEFNFCPDHSDYNHWFSNYFSLNTKRPFFVLYEHINGNCNYVEYNGGKNMNLYKNREAFLDDIDFFINKIVKPNESRYVTVNGRAVIYLWAGNSMSGDFASLLYTAKMNYPVFFLTSVNLFTIPETSQGNKNLRAFDGFMEYSLVVTDEDKNGIPKSDNYYKMIERYNAGSYKWRTQNMKNFKKETGMDYLFIPTWQAAYDDHDFPGRDSVPMYPRNRTEAEHHAAVIKDGMNNGLYNNLGPFVVYSELPEGAAVIESQCLPETVDTEDRFVGCGTARLEILKKYFSN